MVHIYGSGQPYVNYMAFTAYVHISYLRSLVCLFGCAPHLTSKSKQRHQIFYLSANSVTSFLLMQVPLAYFACG